MTFRAFFTASSSLNLASIFKSLNLRVFIGVFVVLGTFGSAYGGEWAEKTLKEMTLEEKVGQLFILPACSFRGEDHIEDLERCIIKKHIGGVIAKGSYPKAQIQMLTELQNLAKIPLLCTIDAENGIAQRIEGVVRFPKNLTLGAIASHELIYLLGKEIAYQCKLLGAHLNFAPVVDVNRHRENPIIHMRSFGDDPQNVAQKAIALSKGMQDGGILTCAKHFPGHGNTAQDSHCELPTLTETLPQLKECDLFPFKRLIESRVDGIMSAHLSVPTIDPGYPATLSHQIITELLRKEMAFEGLTITDALNMSALANTFEPEEIALLAHRAGFDLLLYGDHIDPNIDAIMRDIFPRAYLALLNAYKAEKLPIWELDEKILKILTAKEKLLLHNSRIPPSQENLFEDLNNPSALQLKKELFRQAITLVQDPHKVLPLSKNAVNRIALLQIGGTGEECLPFLLSASRSMSFFKLNPTDPRPPFSVLDGSEQLIVALYEDEVGITPEIAKLLQLLERRYPSAITILFRSPYALQKIPNRQGAYLVAYESEKEAEEAVAQVLFGSLEPRGKLPVRLEN